MRDQTDTTGRLKAGALVIVGGEGGGGWIGGTVARDLRALAISPFVRQRLRVFIAKAHYEELQFLMELIEAGKITPVIDRTYPERGPPGPSGISKKATLAEKSSSPCERTTDQTT